ncbi:MAG: arylsulfatase [Phycisphaerae bacterium]
MTLRALFVMAFLAPSIALAVDAPSKPNIVFILADDLGYNDLGVTGSKAIRTPHIDKLAAEGVRFTAAYCGTSVCAPSRCTLLTGLHTGHAHIRANREIKPEGQEPLPAGTVTVAHLLKSAGYQTACAGKWGLGFPGSSGTPDKMGFDFFYGYNCQRQAHEYFPPHLWRNDQKVQLDGKTYSHDLIEKESLDWIRQAAGTGKPFFLYLAATLPHGKYQAPPGAPASRAGLTPKHAAYVAMCERLDETVGRMTALLKELKVDDNTLVIFASDNGSAGADLAPEQKLRGIKRSMYEGGLRTSAIARWPAKVKPGTTSDAPWAFWDFLPTCAELAGAKLPDGAKTDGLSIVPALAGGPLPERDLYWELYEGKFVQALRRGDWKVVRPGPKAAIQLLNLKEDPNEATDLAAGKAEMVKELEGAMQLAHVPSALWPIKDAATGEGKAGK